MDTATKTRVFNNYRAALKAQPHTISSRAGERKQHALRVTADRYHIPVGEVKRAVRELETEKGITHQHPVPYLEELSLVKEAEKLEAQHHGICPTCSGDEIAGMLYGEIVRPRVNLDADGTRQIMYSCLGHYLDAKDGI